MVIFHSFLYVYQRVLLKSMNFYGVAMKITSKSPVNHWTSHGTLRFGQGVAVVSALDADLDRRDARGAWENGMVYPEMWCICTI